MHGTKWAVVAALAALAATGCSGASASPPPRPEGTGPLTKKVVRTDFDTSAADAGVPASVPDYAGLNEGAEAGSLRSCSIGFKAFGTDTAKTDSARFDAMVRELRERDWQPARKPERLKDKAGAVYVVQEVLKQRGWTTVAEYRDGVITLLGFDDVCTKKRHAGAGPPG